MPKAISSIPLSPFHNISAGDLADHLGVLKANIAELEVREKAMRDELVRRGSPSIEGAAYGATITEAVRWTLDTKALKAEMWAAWYDGHCRQSVVTTVAVKARPIAQQLAA